MATHAVRIAVFDSMTSELSWHVSHKISSHLVRLNESNMQGQRHAHKQGFVLSEPPNTGWEITILPAQIATLARQCTDTWNATIHQAPTPAVRHVA